MAKNGLVSVIIPTFNRAGYLLDAVNSVLNQDYLNLELIVIDDGSTDNTPDIVKKISDNRVRYFRSDKPSSPGIARNRGIGLAKGEYLAFLDSDDSWAKDKLSKQVKFLQNNQDYFLVYSQCYLQKDGILSGISPKKMSEGYIFKKLYLSFNFIPVLTVLMRNLGGNDTYYFNPLQDKNLYIGEDYDLWLNVSRSKKIGYIKEPLAYYTIHSTNMSLDVRRVLHEWNYIAHKYKNQVPKWVFLKKYILLERERMYLLMFEIFRKVLPKRFYKFIKRTVKG